MATATVYATSADSCSTYVSLTTWADAYARDWANSADTSSTSGFFGAGSYVSGSSDVAQYHLVFNTGAALPDGSTINSVTLSLVVDDLSTYGAPTTTFEAYVDDWTADLADIRSSHRSRTELAALYSSPGRSAYASAPGGTGTWNWTSESLFTSQISTTGSIMVVLCGVYNRTGTPGLPEWSMVGTYTQYATTESNRPKLTIDYTVGAPTVTNVNPNYGTIDGGTEVVITGTNLTGATSVKFGTTEATSFTVDSNTQITAVSPSSTG